MVDFTGLAFSWRRSFSFDLIPLSSWLHRAIRRFQQHAQQLKGATHEQATGNQRRSADPVAGEN